MSIIDKQALRWAVRQAQRRLEGEERAEFDAWYAADPRHRGAYLRARAIEQALCDITPERQAIARGDAPAPEMPARRSLLRYGGLAAVLALGAGIAVVAFQPAALEIVAAKEQRREVRLADRSLAVVDGDSRITVRIGARSRQVDIDRGQAWFDVAKDPARPFTVQAGQAHVRAVGTAFAVRRMDADAEVLVTEGVVEVWSGAGERVRVGAGERARVTANAIPVTRDPAGIERALAWRKHTLVFANHTLGSAVADFNRYSGKEIVVADPALLKKTLVGQYRVDQPELFAADMGVFLDVPVAVTAQQIIIGKAPGHAASNQR